MASGARIGREFLVDASTTAPPAQDGSIALDPSGNFVVTFASQDGDSLGVFGRRGMTSGAQGLSVDRHGNATTSSTRSRPRARRNRPPRAALAKYPRRFGGADGIRNRIRRRSRRDLFPDRRWRRHGPLPAGSDAGCFEATADCYQLSVSGARPATHWDTRLTETLSTGFATQWTIHVGESFQDVPTDYPFYQKIETLLHTGITAGCTATEYCPEATVSRAQMAIFIAKAIAGNAGSFLPPASLARKTTTASQAAYHSSTTYRRPTSFASTSTSSRPRTSRSAARRRSTARATWSAAPRWRDSSRRAPSHPLAGPQFLSFMGPTQQRVLRTRAMPRARVLTSGRPRDRPFCKHIHYLWAKGFISGCDATNYCPEGLVTRGAMAKFLTNAFGLQLYGP